MKAHRLSILLLFAITLAPLPAFAGAKPGLLPSMLPSMLMEHFDFYDASIDQRPVVMADQKRWLNDATARLRQDIGAGGHARVLRGAAPRKLLAAIAENYQHPSTCRSCALAAARLLGARYLFIGSIHKISDLICYMRGELDDARTGTVLLVTSTEVKADNKTMWLRAARTLAAAVNQKLRSSQP
jgi:hypothetical protein